jgi:hypothetical protein
MINPGSCGILLPEKHIRVNLQKRSRPCAAAVSHRAIALIRSCREARGASAARSLLRHLPVVCNSWPRFFPICFPSRRRALRRLRAISPDVSLPLYLPMFFLFWTWSLGPALNCAGKFLAAAAAARSYLVLGEHLHVSFLWYTSTCILKILSRYINSSYVFESSSIFTFSRCKLQTSPSMQLFGFA